MTSRPLALLATAALALALGVTGCSAGSGDGVSATAGPTASGAPAMCFSWTVVSTLTRLSWLSFMIRSRKPASIVSFRSFSAPASLMRLRQRLMLDGSIGIS